MQPTLPSSAAYTQVDKESEDEKPRLTLGTLAIVDWEIALIPVLQGLALAIAPPLLYIVRAWGPRNLASAFAALWNAEPAKAQLEKTASLFSSWGTPP
jgi:hypothetical protein